MPKKMSHEEYVEKLKKQHPNLELLSQYNGSNNQIIVRCKIHDYRYPTTPHRLNVSGCIKCYQATIGDRNRKTTEQFIKDAIKVHGDKYDYSKVEYKGNKIKVTIICPIHGEFDQTPNKHLGGQGCDKCADARNGFNKRLSQDEFIKRCKKIHFNKYDYSKVEYTGYDNNITIICPYHGEYTQSAYVHLVGCGCSKCNSSHLEKTVKDLLKGETIVEYYKFPKLGKQNLDIYLPEHNIAIECQGGQHIFPVGYFGGDKGFKKILERDWRKNKICEENGIKLLYVFPLKFKKKLIEYMNNTKDCIYNENNTFILEEIKNKDSLLNKIII